MSTLFSMSRVMGLPPGPISNSLLLLASLSRTRGRLLTVLTSLLLAAVATASHASPLELAPSATTAFPGSLAADLRERLPASARGEAILEQRIPQLRATLLVSPDEPTRVGVLFELAPGWHLYWRNPGETGVAPRIDFELDGGGAGPLAWPAPETFREADGLFTTYGYADSVLLAAERTSAPTTNPAAAATNAAAGQGGAAAQRVRANVDVLVCRTECVPARFALDSPLAPDLPERDRMVVRALFAEANARVPRAAAALGWAPTAFWSSQPPAVDAAGRIALVLDPCSQSASDCDVPRSGLAELEFLPLESEVFEISPPPPVTLAAASADRIELALDATRLEEGDERLRGVLVMRAPDGLVRRAEIDVPIELAAPASASAGIGWIQVVLLAMLGGLILNGMPCVLPVLAIKVVSVADLAERDPREVRLHGLAYTAGVLGSMLALASIVVALRAAGHAVGWGFQFQEPLFVAGIAALLVAFALNLFGVFEIELGQGRLASVGQDATGISRSAFEGLLAVVLATPCTAPFLGTAVGFAFASSGATIVVIFAAIGVGLASPFLLVSFFPALARFVPRSGPWMLKLRAGLGFCLLATVVWLLWIVGQSGGIDAVIALVSALLLLAFLLWTFGQLQPMRSVWRSRASAALIASVAFASFNLIEFERAEANAALPSSSTMTDGFAPYSEEAVRAALAGGRPAFVVFTADWCLTCKVNERTVLARPAVRAALERAGYARFEADWTRRDDGIRAKLAAFGRAGVPLYLVYDPATPERPRVLSELLTQEAVLAALEAAAPPHVARRP